MYRDRPLKVDRIRGVRVGMILDPPTGQFVRADRDVVADAVASSNQTEIFTMDYDEFVHAVESTRAATLSGTGPVFALYELTRGIYQSVQAEGRRPRAEEVELIESIYRQTFALWESGEARS